MLTTKSSPCFICLECQLEQISTTNLKTSIDSRRYSIEEFFQMLKHIFDRIRSYPQAKNLQRIKNLSNFVFPIDLETIGKKIRDRNYRNLHEFLGDFLWIFHNVYLSHGNENDLTDLARTLLSLTRHEINEFQLCPQCYLRSFQTNSTNGFIEPCSPPHVLCWAKMNTYQPWPGKLLRVVNDLADIRFFGEHDRAWVPLKQCFVLSETYPNEKKTKSNRIFDQSLVELNSHIERLKQVYGHFHYAPSRTTISKSKAFRFVSSIDDSRPPTYLDGVESTSIVNENFETKRKRSADFSTSNESKRLCFSPICIDDEVETSTSSSDKVNRIQALLKKYLDSPSISVDPTPSDDDRISFSPDRIEPTTIYPCLSLDESISHQLPSIPIRPLSVSPNRFEETTTNQQQSAILTELLPKIDDPKKNVWLSALSVSPEPSPITISVPFQLEQSLLSANLTKTLNDQFQTAMINFTEQINAYLDRYRLKHERDLENLRQSYCLSLNDLHTAATERMRELHQVLEIQYRKRLTELRQRYETTLNKSTE